MRPKAFLEKAKSNKADEFYTSMVDIEAELSYYRDCFKGKVVYCNADHPKISNFFKYFINNFQELGLKELICTYYRPFRFDDNGWPEPPPYLTRVKWADGRFESYGDLVRLFNGTNLNKLPSPMRDSGDFRSSECIELLKEADIVVSNPPFSLFREYFAQLVEYDKKFLILGLLTQIGYRDIFKQLQENKVWLGVNSPSHTWFRVPEDYSITTKQKIKYDENGNKLFDVCNVMWLTNLEHGNDKPFVILNKKYDTNVYPKYDNYDAIEVSRLENIPLDYSGVMGVPVSFMAKYNPLQFKIVGFRKGNDGKDLSIKGKELYLRILIERVGGN